MRQPFESRFAARLKAEAATREAAREAARAARTAPSDAPPDPETALARANQVAQNARAIWFGLLGYLAFVTLALLGVRDVDFFSLEATVDLPIVNIAIPTKVFFWSAAWLAAAFHAFLQIHLLKLWDPLAKLPATLKGHPVAESLQPWIVIDWALHRRPDAAEAAIHRPLAGLAEAVALAAVWLAAPAVIAAFWWRSMSARDEATTIAIAGALTLALYASRRNWRRARAVLKQPGRAPPAENLRRRICRGGAVFALALTLAGASWLRTEGGLDHYAAPLILARSDARLTEAERTAETSQQREARHAAALRAFAFDAWLAPLDLADADLAGRPDGWADHPVAERRFAIGWCRDRAIRSEACHAPTEEDFGDADALRQAREDHARARRLWCEEGGSGRQLAPAACDARFAALGRMAAAEWSAQRASQIERLLDPDMRGRDLRRTRAEGAFFVGLDFSEARLEGALLSGARMERAILNAARLDAADLRGAHMESAILRAAQLDAADLRRARMQGAILDEARLRGATLSEALMERAYLRGARMDAAILAEARLAGADLSGAQLRGAVLRAARLEGADLSGAQLQNAVLTATRMQGANLFGAQLDGAALNLAQMGAAVLSWARLEGAVLTGARLEGADLFEARMTRADLREAQLARADLGNARLQGADLFRAQLDGAYLNGARLDEAYLSAARLDGADLRAAQLKGADLSWARLAGADLRAASFGSARWADAAFGPSPAHGADFSDGRSLTQSQLDDGPGGPVIGDADTLLPRDAETGEQLVLWSCWETPPPDFDAMLARYPSWERHALRDRWLCQRHPAIRTGRPAP